MIREAIALISSGTDLTPAEAGRVMEEIMRGAATPAQVGGFLTALRMKGESETEIAAFARAMRAAAIESLPQEKQCPKIADAREVSGMSRRPARRWPAAPSNSSRSALVSSR